MADSYCRYFMSSVSTANASVVDVTFLEETRAEFYMQLSNEAADRAARDFDAGLVSLAEFHAEIADAWASLAKAAS